MDIVNRIRSFGDITPTSRLRAAGHSARELRAALAAGSLERPRRGWVALPSVDPALRFAARNGVLLSCITQAKRRGLWTFDAPHTHVAARTPSSQPPAEPRRLVVHWARPLVPRPPDALVDPLENVLALVVACQPAEAAAVVLESALNRGLATVQSLEMLPLSKKFRNLLAESTPFSDSGLETLFRTRLRWMRVSIRFQISLLGHRVDFLIGERLVVQIDGGHHVGDQREQDIRHDAELQLTGYHVLRFGYWQIIDHWEEVQDLIMRAIARNLHLAA